MAKQNSLKKPFVVWGAAIAFLLAPIGNTMFSLYQTGHETWYSPASWIWLLQNIPIVELILLLLIFVAGLALFFQSRTSWTIAVLVVLIVSSKNIFFPANDSRFMSMYNLPILLNLPIVLVLFYFRYPYLDKRDRLFEGVRKRYRVKLGVKIKGEEHLGEVDSLSASGAHIKMPPETWAPPLNSILELTLILPEKFEEKSEFNLTLFVSYHDASGFGGSFIKSGFQQKAMIRRYCLQHGTTEEELEEKKSV